MKKIVITIACLLSVLTSSFAQPVIELSAWKFQKGDNPEWAASGWDDSAWKPIRVGVDWAAQGYSGGGLGWYRIKFMLPLAMKEAAKSGVVRLSLGKINDYDQAWINGRPLGENGRLIRDTSVENLGEVPSEADAHGRERNYAVWVDDPRLRWGQENVLAVRVKSGVAAGGLCSSSLNVAAGGLADALEIDAAAEMLQKNSADKLSQTVWLRSLSSLPEIEGKLTMAAFEQETGRQVASRDFDVALKAAKEPFTLVFAGDMWTRLRITCTFVGGKTAEQVSVTRLLPYLLTPKAPETPRINGAKVVGVGVDRDFLFRIAATGERPMNFAAEGLPKGLSLDARTGIITGRVKASGDYSVKLKAANGRGEVVRDLKIVVGGLLALTPPMGWNSWNGLGYDVSQLSMQKTVDLILSSGLADHGWTYVNLDIGWEPMQRNADGSVTPNVKFPDMKGMVDYIHRHGFKAGTYISAGPKACSVYGVELGIGSYQHEEADAQMFANWGFDYLKYDWCSYPGKDFSPAGLQKPFKVMKAALNKTQRDFVFSLGGWDSWEWGGSIGGNLWRVVSDLEDSWESIQKGFHIEKMAPYAKPGNWNDPDMLGIGWGWFGDNRVRLHPSRLTPDEQYTHISLWSLLSAPLLIGCDLTKLDDFTLNLLTNDEVIAIDQDPLGKQALPVMKNDRQVIMLKKLEDGSKAIGLFNLTDTDLKIVVDWNSLALDGPQQVRDVWRQKDLGRFANGFEASVPAHGVILIKVDK